METSQSNSLAVVPPAPVDFEQRLRSNSGFACTLFPEGSDDVADSLEGVFATKPYQGEIWIYCLLVGGGRHGDWLGMRQVGACFSYWPSIHHDGGGCSFYFPLPADPS